MRNYDDEKQNEEIRQFKLWNIAIPLALLWIVMIFLTLLERLA